MRRTFERLEIVLRGWEDYWFLNDLLSKAVNALGARLPYGREGAMITHGDFRRYLQTLGTSPLVPKELSRFAVPAHMELPSTLITLHASLATWCQHGHVVYEVSAATQQKLGGVPLANLTWTDVPFPRLAFAVTLEQPLVGERLEDVFDLIVVGPYMASAMYGRAPVDFRINEIRAFRSSVDYYRPLGPKRRQALQRRLAQKQYHELADELDTLMSKVSKISSFVIAVGEEATTKPIESSRPGTGEPMAVAASLVQGFVARLCLCIADSSAAVAKGLSAATVLADSIVGKAQVYTVT